MHTSDAPPQVLTSPQLDALADAGGVSLSSSKSAVTGLNWVANIWLTAFSEREADAQLVETAKQCRQRSTSLRTLLTIDHSVGSARFKGELLRRLETESGISDYISMLSQLEKVEIYSLELEKKYKSKKGRPNSQWMKTNITLLIDEYYRMNGTKALPSNDDDEATALRNPQFRFVREFTKLIDTIANSSPGPLEMHPSFSRRGKDFIREMKHKSTKGLIDLLRKASKEAETLSLSNMPYGWKIERGTIIALEKDPFLDRDDANLLD